MDIIVGLFRAGLTLLAIAAIIGLIAALFMFVFSIATGIDERIQS